MKWYIMTGSRQSGPFTEGEIRAMLERGSIGRGCLIRQGDSEWHTTGEVRRKIKEHDISMEPPHYCYLSGFGAVLHGLGWLAMAAGVVSMVVGLGMDDKDICFTSLVLFVSGIPMLVFSDISILLQQLSTDSHYVRKNHEKV